MSLSLTFRFVPGASEDVSLAAELGGEPVGIAQAARTTETEVARLQAVVVSEPFRRRGIATALVDALASRLANDGVRRIEAYYDARRGNVTIVEALLRKVGFDWPYATAAIGIGTARMLQARWAGACPRPGDQMVPWTILEAAAGYLRSAAWYPPTLGPFAEEPYEPLNSMGLIVDRRVVGWCITHRVAPETIRYSRLFVHPEYRIGQRGLALLVRAIEAQVAAGITYGKFSVRTDNHPMIGFVRRRLAPYLDSLEETACAERSL